MAVFEIEPDIYAIESDTSLYDEKNFDKRIGAIDFLEFHIIDHIDGVLQKTAQPDELLSLKQRAEKIKSDLEEIDISLFKRLRENIRPGKDFKKLVTDYVELKDNKHREEAGYDNLDIFINGLLSFQPIPEQTKNLEPEMVFYQKTPARIVFELVETANFTKDDVFFDLGSGLGQVAILVNLLTGVTAKGIEFEPSFCDYSRDCAETFNLSNVSFINTDAREADYSEGTLFFMYTPFSGEMLQEVLERLREESRKRKIKVVTYGPCTAEVAMKTWLEIITPKDDSIYKLAIFNSL